MWIYVHSNVTILDKGYNSILINSNAQQIHTCVRLLELLLISEAEEGVSGRLC